LEPDAPHLERIRPLSLHTFSFTLPRGWEVTAYLLDESDGQLQLYERKHFRGQLVWRKTPKPPDELRIMNEIQRRHLEKELPERAKRFGELSVRKVGDFSFGYSLEGEPCQASLYQPKTSTLVQWVFPELGDDALATIEPLLLSYRPNEQELRRWEMFGVRLALPSALAFTEMAPLPANVAVTFESKHHLTVVARRLGMVEETLRTITMAQLHRALLRQGGARIVSSEERQIRGCTGVYTTYEKRGERRLEQLAGRYWKGEAFLWLEKDERRIYGLEQVGPQRAKRLDLLDAFQA
jgi:hypothetical protein